jgi:hypothetical protein
VFDLEEVRTQDLADAHGGDGCTRGDRDDVEQGGALGFMTG